MFNNLKEDIEEAKCCGNCEFSKVLNFHNDGDLVFCLFGLDLPRIKNLDDYNKFKKTVYTGKNQVQETNICEDFVFRKDYKDL